MKKLVQISVIITLCTTSILAIYLILLVVKVERAARVLVPKLDATLISVQAIETNTTRTEAELSGLLNETRHIATDERAAQQDQLMMVKQLSTKVYMLVDDADAAVKNLGEVAPNLTESIQYTTRDVHNTMVDSQELLQAATKQISDPSIGKAIDNMDMATLHTANATANVDATTKDIRDYVHRETTPVRGFWNAVKGLINLTWSIRGAAGF